MNTMLIAITREVSPNIGRCELTHLPREPIDFELARAQHQLYEKALTSLGCKIQHLPAEPAMPDSVFVEDTAVVLDELAIITCPGADRGGPRPQRWQRRSGRIGSSFGSNRQARSTAGPWSIPPPILAHAGDWRPTASRLGLSISRNWPRPRAV